MVKVKELFRTLIVALLIALVFRSFVYENYRVQSGSMTPTLLTGDYLFISKFAYGYSRYSMPFGIPLIKDRIFSKQPKRGDIIVFKLPSDTSINYIKRLIGLPGDEVQLFNGNLYINGQLVKRKEIKKHVQAGPLGEHITYNKYTETLPNGVSYDIISYPEHQNRGFPGTTHIYKVPPGHFFFLGDNRNNSIDSRFEEVGFVPMVNLVGRAEIIFFTQDFSFLDFITKYNYDRVFTRLSNAN